MTTQNGSTPRPRPKAVWRVPTLSSAGQSYHNPWPHEELKTVRSFEKASYRANRLQSHISLPQLFPLDLHGLSLLYPIIVLHFLGMVWMIILVGPPESMAAFHTSSKPVPSHSCLNFLSIGQANPEDSWKFKVLPGTSWDLTMRWNPKAKALIRLIYFEPPASLPNKVSRELKSLAWVAALDHVEATGVAMSSRPLALFSFCVQYCYII